MPRTTFAVLLILAALIATISNSVAQEATPAIELTPGDGCDVAPRDESDLDALNATATSRGATPVAVNPMEMPGGLPVDAATLNALDLTLKQVVACAETGDLARLLALYSDAYVANIALAPEPAPIIPGQRTDGLPVPAGTPGIARGVEPGVEIAVKLGDGRIAALVTASGLDGTDEIVLFTYEREMWVIDEIHPALPKGPIGGDLPFPVQAAVAAAAAEFDVSADEVTVVSYEPVDWPDTSLGCPREGEFYAAVITPGYRVILAVIGQQHEYHTDDIDRAIRCDPA